MIPPGSDTAPARALPHPTGMDRRADLPFLPLGATVALRVVCFPQTRMAGGRSSMFPFDTKHRVWRMEPEEPHAQPCVKDRLKAPILGRLRGVGVPHRRDPCLSDIFVLLVVAVVSGQRGLPVVEGGVELSVSFDLMAEERRRTGEAGWPCPASRRPSPSTAPAFQPLNRIQPPPRRWRPDISEKVGRKEQFSWDTPIIQLPILSTPLTLYTFHFQEKMFQEVRILVTKRRAHPYGRFHCSTPKSPTPRPQPARNVDRAQVRLVEGPLWLGRIHSALDILHHFPFPTVRRRGGLIFLSSRPESSSRRRQPLSLISSSLVLPTADPGTYRHLPRRGPDLNSTPTGQVARLCRGSNPTGD